MAYGSNESFHEFGVLFGGILVFRVYGLGFVRIYGFGFRA